MTLTEYPIPVQPWLVGTVMEWPGPVARIPNVWLLSYGQSVLRATYAALFRALCELKGAVTFTSASPAVFTFTAHGLVIGDPVFFTGSPGTSGVVANTTYYVMTVPTANTFTVGTTRTINVITGVVTVTTALNTINTGAGTVYLWYAPYEVADSTHFYLPDYRGRTAISPDNMGGTDAALLGWSNVLGIRAGEGTHTLLSAESGQPAGNTGAGTAHTHGFTAGSQPLMTGLTTFNWSSGAGLSAGVANIANESAHTHPLAAANAAGGHNIVQPSIAVNKIIYAGVST